MLSLQRQVALSLKCMHEISLVKNILRTLEETFPEKIGKLRNIYLQVGILSNVQPILMQNAFEAVLLDEPRYNNSSLYVEVLPVLIYCDACDKNTGVFNYSFVCTCGKPSNNIVQGLEMMINKVEFDEA